MKVGGPSGEEKRKRCEGKVSGNERKSQGETRQETTEKQAWSDGETDGMDSTLLASKTPPLSRQQRFLTSITIPRRWLLHDSAFLLETCPPDEAIRFFITFIYSLGFISCAFPRQACIPSSTQLPRCPYILAPMFAIEKCSSSLSNSTAHGKRRAATHKGRLDASRIRNPERTDCFVHAVTRSLAR